MFISLLLIFSQLSTAQFQAGNMACWATGNFYNSQPLSMYVNIPVNATLLELAVSRGSGNYNSYSLRRCSYPACTNFLYYNAACPVVATLGFGTTNVTNLLSPGTYQLTFDSLNDIYSTEITGATLSVHFPVFTYSATDKACSYGETTSCSANATAVGSGTCFFPTSAQNVSITSSGTTVPFWFNSSQVEWNCSNANYSLYLGFPPIQYNESYAFLNSNLSAQLVNSTLAISNPFQDNFSNVPFSFAHGNYNGTVDLTSGETRFLSTTFSTNAISYNVSILPVQYNFSIGYTDVGIEAVNSLPATFTFETAELPLAGFGCPSLSAPMNQSANFSMRCFPEVSHSFSNWTALNNTLLSAVLTVDSGVNFSTILLNASHPFNFENVTVVPEIFNYSEPMALNFSGDFLVTSLNVTSFGETDAFNYSFHIYNPSNDSINITAAINFSAYSEVKMNEALVPECPAIVCFANSTLFVTVFNSTNLTIFATRRAEIQISVSNSQQSSSGSISGHPPLSLVVLNTKKNGVEEEIIFNGTSADENSPLERSDYRYENLETSVPVPSSVSGLEAASPSSFLEFLPLLLLVPLFFLLRKKQLVRRKRVGTLNQLTFTNDLAESIEGIVLQEVLPQGTKASVECTDSVIGKIALWNRDKLKPGEKWDIAYSSSEPPKRGKLCFKHKGKQVEKLF